MIFEGIIVGAAVFLIIGICRFVGIYCTFAVNSECRKDEPLLNF